LLKQRHKIFISKYLNANFKKAPAASYAYLNKLGVFFEQTENIKLESLE